MNILIDTPKGQIRDVFFPEQAISELKKLGNVVLNDTCIPFTEKDMAKYIKDVDVCITHWDTPEISDSVLENANRLSLIAHAAGSVANVVSERVYEKGILVCSANTIMAKYVAEGVLAYILAGLRKIPDYDRDMKNGEWNRKITQTKTLFEEKIGLIGLGTVGSYLLELLKPFDVRVRLYDPYISKTALDRYHNVKTGSLEDVLSWGNIISVHASLTPETYHLLDKKKLNLIHDGALFINTARGAVIDQEALIDELTGGRITAVLDVFENEPLDPDNCLRKLDNVTLMPHVAGTTAREQMTFGIINEIRRYINGEPLEYEIPYSKYKLMTREK